jgi:hypothetical protein
MATTPLFVHPTLTGAAIPYYAMFPIEPTPSDNSTNWIRTGKPVGLKTKRVDELLTKIAAEVSAGGSVLIAAHGNKQGLSLSVGDEKAEVHLEFDALQAIRRNQEGKDADDETAKILKMTVDAYKHFKSLIEKVQQRSLARVDVRACNIGQNDVATSALQVFFNCDTFCAPSLLDSFGIIGYQPFAKGATFDKWVNSHLGAVVNGTSSDRFAIFQDLSKGVNTAAVAESAIGATDWAAAHLPPGGTFKGQQVLPYHGLTDLKNHMFFAGDPEFHTNLVEAYRGREPSRRVDINQPLSR